MFGMKIVSVNSKHYHPWQPWHKSSKSGNPGHLCKFSCQMSLFLFNPSSQTVQHFYKEHNQTLKVVLLQVAFYVKA